MTSLSVQREAAIAAVDAWLVATFTGSAKADNWRLQQHGFKTGTRGWTLPVNAGTSLLVVVDERFPYTNPRTAIFGPDAPADAPHVEDNLRLCTLGSTARTDSNDPVGVVREYIEHSLALLLDLSEGKHQDDYIVDFEAYWRRASPDARSVWTLGDFEGASQDGFSVTRGKRTVIVSTDEARLRQWLSNFMGEPFEAPFSPAIFLWLEKLPVPSEYPATIPQIRELVELQAPAALERVEALIASDENDLCLVFAGQTADNAVGRGAFVLTRPSTSIGRPSIKGFRPGKAPRHLLTLARKVVRGNTSAVDAAKTRLPPSMLAGLEGARVVVIGCGSLGSGVARLLVQSGVRAMQIFDPDLLGWENIGRHELGALHVGRNKASSLAATLMRQLPDCQVIGHEKDWRDITSKDEGVWANTDIVISATADWGSDCALADLQANGIISCPIIYGWMERNAAAAHAVALAGPERNFRAGFDITGNARIPATSWWEPEFIPGCGAGTSAYGAVELGIACSHVAGMALDIITGVAQTPVWRVSVTSTAMLESAGGYWSTAFRALVGDPGVGARTYALIW